MGEGGPITGDQGEGRGWMALGKGQGCREERALLRTNCVRPFKVLSHRSGWSLGSFAYESASGGASVQLR